jgi:hypothetical protein
MWFRSCLVFKAVVSLDLAPFAAILQLELDRSKDTHASADVSFTYRVLDITVTC